MDPDDPLDPPGPPVIFAEPTVGRRATPEQARLTLHTQLDQWAREGRRYFAPRDLCTLVGQVGRTITDPRAAQHARRRERLIRVEEGAYRLRRKGVG